MESINLRPSYLIITHAQVPSSFFSEVAQLSVHFGDWATEDILELSWPGKEDLDDVA